MSTWNNNAVQFPRLLAEIMATQNLDLPALVESMDLTLDEVNELFDRADTVWESAKAGTVPAIVINLNVFDGEGAVVKETSAEMTLDQVSDVVGHAVQLVQIERRGRRSSGDTKAVIAELEEAVEASGVLDDLES